MALPPGPSRARRPVSRAGVALLVCLACLAAVPGHGQESDPAERAAQRIRALQREAEDLASRERTLLDELRAIEVQREIEVGRLQEAERQLAGIEADLAATTARIHALESSAAAQRPDLAARIVDLYKLRNGGYLRLLLSVSSVQEMGRAYRFASAMQHLDGRRLEEYRRTVADLRRSAEALRERQVQVTSLKADASRAAAAAAAAAAAHSALVDRIDARRDLNARLIGELQVARDRLQTELERLGHESLSPGTAVLPIGPFRGALDWPVTGRLLSAFGRSRDPRARVSVLNNGIQVGAPAGSAVRAVHDGVVSFAGPFTGFGNLVIVDHGGLAYSLYGQLGEISVEQGRGVAKGAPIGTVGTSVDGTPALYFEMRIDAAPVDPLQWLKTPPGSPLP